MTRSHRVRIAGITAGVASLVAASSGITYAATTLSSAAAFKAAPTYGVACDGARNVLRLYTTGCPRGTTAIALAQAPAALDIGGKGGEKGVQVGDVEFVALCSASGGFADLVMESPAGYDVQGDDVFADGGGGSFSAGVVGHTVDHAAGASLITFGVSAAARESGLEVERDGGATGTFEVVQGAHTMSVTFSLFAFGACSVQAQITPSA